MAAAITPEPTANPRKIFIQTGVSGCVAIAISDPTPTISVVPIM